VNQQLWWFVARASGLVSWFLCTLAILWGVALSTRLLGKRPTPAWLLDLHRFLGALATIFAAVHVVAVVADSYVHFGITEVLVPLASSWKPGPVAWGIAGFYLLIAVELTSLARRRLPARLWRLVHTASLPLWVFSTAHLLTAGTDAGNAAVGSAVLLSASSVVFVVLVRILSPGRRRGAVGLNRRQPASPAVGSGPSAPVQRRRSWSRARSGSGRHRQAWG
jgi:DMSO/TMAO reductase YedYZ heme-binding membrane subunit